MAKSKYIEALEEQYTKKDAKSVLRYKAPDNKWRYIQSSKSPDGGDTPTPTPSGGMTEVTWQELKDKRDNGELNPGSLYRITDYNCTTTQENTQSAGHQFDIVLLALSENKLAEEGWAMEHPTDVYDVTFADGVTKKCYLANERNDDWGEGPVPVCDIIDTESLLGRPNVQKDYMTIDRENKTISFIPDSIYSTDLTEENLTYNYFQNSNLSAWKVWYCLDNDKSRFAWADDSVDGEPASINITHPRFGEMTLYRYKTDDIILNNTQYYCWCDYDATFLCTLSEIPQINDKLYGIQNDEVIELNFNVDSYTPPTGTQLPVGRGVIYRLIDEWGNDCPYDFKNIQFDLGKGWYAPFYDGNEHTRDASLDGTFANNKVVPNGEGLLGIISNNIYDVKGCIFVHTDQIYSFQPADNAYNVIIKDGSDLRLW